METKKSIRRIALMVMGTLLFVQGYAQYSTTFKFSETAPEHILRVMENNANALFSEINRKYDQDTSKLSLSSDAITEFARNRIANMWAVSHFYCTRTSMNTRVLKMVNADVYQVRNIPIYFQNGESEEYKYRSAVLEFDLSGQIIDLYCSIPEREIKRADGSVAIDFKHKELINNFLNNYTTAYYCKDLDLIEKVFSEDALIISGNVVNYKTSSKTDLSRLLITDRRIEYSIQNKRLYMEKLRKIFQRNSFINIKIDGIEIIQSEANPKIYGVRLNQYWNAGGYYDEGRLFFIIDFSNENQPEIMVTTWQPFKDAQGNPIEYSEEDYFSIGDFQIE